jgi:thioredoxin
MADGNRRSDVLEINDLNFDRDVLSSRVPFLVDFGAKWCGPCKVLEASIHALASERDAVRFGKVDTDESREVAARLGVRAVPTVILFRDGKEVARHVGLLPKEKLRAFASR